MTAPKRGRGRPKRERKPIPKPHTMSAAEFKAALAELAEAGVIEEPAAVSFAARAGIEFSTVYRWISRDAVPTWAAWIVALLLERLETSAKLARPAE